MRGSNECVHKTTGVKVNIDAFHPLVFDLQFHCRLFANLTFLLIVRAAWARNGRLAQVSPWSAGPRARGASWAAFRRVGSLSASPSRASLTDCCTTRSAGEGLLWLGILPAILCVFIRYSVKEPAVWVENHKRQREQEQVVRAPLCHLQAWPAQQQADRVVWPAGASIVYYPVYGLFATWLGCAIHVVKNLTR